MNPPWCSVAFLVTVLVTIHGAPQTQYDPTKIYFPTERTSSTAKESNLKFGALIIPIILVKIEPAILPDEERVDYTGTQVWNVPTTSENHLRVIFRLKNDYNVTTWGGDHSAVDIMVRSNAVENVSSVLYENNIPFKIIMNDLQRYINLENPLTEETQDRQARAYSFWNAYRIKGRITMPVIKPANRRMAEIGAYLGYNSIDERMELWPTANWGHRMTWSRYHRLADIYDYMDYMSRTYDFCSVQSIGKSVEGRDIKVLRISTGGNNKKAVWIDGGIHAREWISPATVTYMINAIVENFDIETEAVRNIEWYFLPVVNPDGYEYTHKVDRMWRKNRRNFGLCYGVDLNRNFGYHWGGKGTSRNPCSDVFSGYQAFSEPESRAVKDFMERSSANFKLYASYHSYGEYILFPWGYDAVQAEDHSDLNYAGNRAKEAIVKAGGPEYRVGMSSTLLYPAAGGSDDWAKGSQNIKYSYTIELSDRGNYGFILPASQILKVARESFAGLKVLAEIAYLS